MKSKFKIFGIALAMCLVVIMLTVGVYSLRNVDMTIGGNITYTADGIVATVSQGVLGGSSSDVSGKMQSFSIAKNTSLDDTATQRATWQGLVLAFDENGTEVTIKFTIKNDHDTKDLSVSITVNAGSDVENATIQVQKDGGALANSVSDTLSHGATGNYTISFKVTDVDFDAHINSFAIAVALTQA